MKEDTPEARSARLLQLSDEVKRIAGSLAELSAGVREEAPQRSSSDDAEALLDWVNWLIRARKYRARYLPPELFAEPAWDILLDLLRAELAYERVSVSRACTSADIPVTTGLRWLKALENQGMVERRPDPLDARRNFVVLSAKASEELRRYFFEVVGTAKMGEPAK